ncbi:DUF4158 domain-containing protein [Nonomuraea sp. NPDC049129]|uniref:DUF4158 domain-containing protein n=1 Tax=Nonomuraea sp. NPDC049129 TaxID=3155272 RepID=UPI0033EDA903
MARGTVRMLGTFLLDPRDVPHVAVDYVAEQIGVADPSCIKLYPERTQTKWDHQGEIRELLEYQEFVEVQAGLLRFLGSRVRHFRVSRRELFDRAVVWLIDNKVVLPGMAG